MGAGRAFRSGSGLHRSGEGLTYVAAFWCLLTRQYIVLDIRHKVPRAPGSIRVFAGWLQLLARQPPGVPSFRLSRLPLAVVRSEGRFNRWMFSLTASCSRLATSSSVKNSRSARSLALRVVCVGGTVSEGRHSEGTLGGTLTPALRTEAHQVGDSPYAAQPYLPRRFRVERQAASRLP